MKNAAGKPAAFLYAWIASPKKRCIYLGNENKNQFVRTNEILAAMGNRYWMDFEVGFLVFLNAGSYTTTVTPSSKSAGLRPVVTLKSSVLTSGQDAFGVWQIQ